MRFSTFSIGFSALVIAVFLALFVTVMQPRHSRTAAQVDGGQWSEEGGDQQYDDSQDQQYDENQDQQYDDSQDQQYDDGGGQPQDEQYSEAPPQEDLHWEWNSQSEEGGSDEQQQASEEYFQGDDVGAAEQSSEEPPQEYFQGDSVSEEGNMQSEEDRNGAENRNASEEQASQGAGEMSEGQSSDENAGNIPILIPGQGHSLSQVSSEQADSEASMESSQAAPNGYYCAENANGCDPYTGQEIGNGFIYWPDSVDTCNELCMMLWSKVYCCMQKSHSCVVTSQEECGNRRSFKPYQQEDCERECS